MITQCSSSGRKAKRETFRAADPEREKEKVLTEKEKEKEEMSFNEKRICKEREEGPRASNAVP